MCVQASDIIDGRLEDGVEEILGMRNGMRVQSYAPREHD